MRSLASHSLVLHKLQTMDDAAANDVIDLISEDEDESTDEDENDDTVIRILKLGDPIPKPSVRVIVKPTGTNMSKPGNNTFKRWNYNPASKAMSDFKALAREQICDEEKQPGFDFEGFPVWGPGTGVSVTVWFCKRPPNNFFINNDRTRPKHNALLTPCTVKPDTDNCLKFILDSLSKLVWADDNQVDCICAKKLYDNCPPYEGRTIVELRPLLGARTEGEDTPFWATINGDQRY